MAAIKAPKRSPLPEPEAAWCRKIVLVARVRRSSARIGGSRDPKTKPQRIVSTRGRLQKAPWKASSFRTVVCRNQASAATQTVSSMSHAFCLARDESNAICQSGPPLKVLRGHHEHLRKIIIVLAQPDRHGQRGAVDVASDAGYNPHRVPRRENAAVAQADHLVAGLDRGADRNVVYDRRLPPVSGEHTGLADARDKHAQLLVRIGEQPDHARLLRDTHHLSDHAPVGDNGRAFDAVIQRALVDG